VARRPQEKKWGEKKGEGDLSLVEKNTIREKTPASVIRGELVRGEKGGRGEDLIPGRGVPCLSMGERDSKKAN